MKSNSRQTIVEYLHRYLAVAKFPDYCVNGLQVAGRDKISRVVCGVSISERLIEAAVAQQADLICVHHGIFKDSLGSPPAISGCWRRRLQLLLQADVNLCGYHLPLDAHPRIGNNISICKALGVTSVKPLDVGFVGKLERKLSLTELSKLVDQQLQTKSQVVPGGNHKVKRLAVISGGSSDYYSAAAAAGADAFICGDLREHVVRAAEECGIHLINGGHYNTERFGIQNLGKLLARRFGLAVDYVEVPCEI